MRTYRNTERFQQEYEKLSDETARKFQKQLFLLRQDLRHPSLRVKKMRRHRDIYEARVDYHHRFTFNLEGEMIVLRTIGHHDEVLRRP